METRFYLRTADMQSEVEGTSLHQMLYIPKMHELLKGHKDHFTFYFKWERHLYPSRRVTKHLSYDVN